MPDLARELAALGADSAWLDGEIVVSGPDGDNDFNALQNAFDRRRTQAIEYFVFDLPFFEGHDLRELPLRSRRELLREWLDQALMGRPPSPLRFSTALGEGGAADAAKLLRSACAARREGIIAKRDDAPYRSTRGTYWLKLKCQHRQEFVIGGYTLRSDDARAVGSLILGVHDDQGRLRHAGRVGTGWDQREARALLARLRPLDDAAPPFDSSPAAARAKARWVRRAPGQEHWVNPRLVAEVNFGEWTPTGHIRHASFVALRSDKPARAIVRELPVPREALCATTSARASSAVARTQVKVSHPDRVIDAASGLTKLDLVRYYGSVAEFMLPHLVGRPVALLRGPGGVGEALFFQKHGGKAPIPGLFELDPSLWPDHEALLEVRTAEGLVGAAQMNAIEFHAWNSTTRRLLQPDRIVFDLDPGEGVQWPAVREGAQLTRTLLQALGLQCWVKTSGGKGLHVVVPVAPRHDFDTVKAFSRAVVQHLAQTIPDRFVVKSGPDNRRGRIFVDYLRNGEGATTVAAFSARARPGLGVSMPISWDELDSVKGPAQFTVANARDHLSLRRTDPWADLAGTRQALGAPMKALGFKPAQE